MKTIYRAENIVDAHLVRNALESVGIPAHVAGEYLTGALGELPAMGLVAVMVADHDAPRAIQIAAEIDADLADQGDFADSDPASDPEPLPG
jgi:predicted nucleic acid-binding protein